MDRNPVYETQIKIKITFILIKYNHNMWGLQYLSRDYSSFYFILSKMTIRGLYDIDIVFSGITVLETM